MKISKPEDVFDKSAKIYQDKFMDVSLYAEGLNLFCDRIAGDHAHILDIACGPGNLIKYLLNRRPDYDILGVDLAPRMLELAQVNNPGAKFRLMDCRDIGSIEEQFDGITCGFCMPYLTLEEAVELIANVGSLLNTGGMFYLSTMVESDQSKSRYQTSSTGDQVYVHYHREDDLVAAFLGQGFELMKVQHFSAPDKDGILITDLVLIGRLNSPVTR